MKRVYNEAFGPMEQEQSKKKSKISHELAQDRDTSASAQLPKDVWSIITKNLHMYDVMFLRATSSALFKWCKEFKPFPKFFVLDQYKCMEYLVENGFTSLLEYVKNTLRFEWTPNLVTVAARSGQVSTLQHLVNNGLALNDQLMLECTKHSCDLSMIKYLHENGVPWDCASTAQSYKSKVTIVSTTPMEYMAYHGHLDCIKYAMENGCTERVINYTPSIECLDFAIQNGFTWQGERAQRGMASFATIKKGICEEAARLGDLTMLKYAHQKGAPLKQSASQANLAGHLDCLIYASESESPKTYPVPNMSRTLDCFKYLVQADGGRLKDFYNMEMFWSDLVRIGNIETLRYLLANKFPIPTDPLSIDYSLAIDSCFSSAEMFKFILDEAKMSFEYVNVYLHCIAHSNLEGLKLCFERNLPNKSPAEIEAARPQEPRRLGIRAAPSNDSLVQQFIMKAIEATNVDVLKLLWEKFPNKEGLDMDKCLNGAARDSTPEICDFLTRHGAQWTSEHLRLTSVLGNLPNMAYLTRMGCKWNGNACSPSNAMIYKYAREHGLTKINSSSK